jgi:O-antigen/teichoic acid export membrane protein
MVWSLQLVVTSAVSPVLAHLLTPVQFGQVATSVAVYQVLIVLAVFGLDQAIIVEFASGTNGRARAAAVASFGALVATGVTVLIFVLGPLWSRAIGFDSFTGIIMLAVLWTGPSAVCLLILALLRAQDRIGGFFAVSVLSSIGGQVLGVFLLLGGSRSTTTYGWAGVISQCAGMGLGLIVVGYRPTRHVIEWEASRRALSLGAPMAAAALSMFVLNAGDRIVLQRMLGSAAVGRYQIAYTVGSVGILMMAFLNQAWLPRILAVADADARWQLVAASRDRLLRLLVPSVIALVIVAPIALELVAPERYTPRSLVVVVFWVAIAAFPVADCAASSRALLALRRPLPLALCTLVAAVANIVLNIALIPSLGLAGSALATAVAFSLQALLARVALSRRVLLPQPTLGVVALVGAGCAVAGLSTLAPSSGGWLLVRLATVGGLVAWALVELRFAARAKL